jgi:hypothetical protein
MRYLVLIVLFVVNCSPVKSNNTENWTMAKSYSEIEGTWSPEFTGIIRNNNLDSIQPFTSDEIYWHFQADSFNYYQ